MKYMVLLFLIVLSSSSQASLETLKPLSSPLPSFAQNAEGATVAFFSFTLSQKYDSIGTGFLVYVEESKHGALGFFLTDAHVTRNLVPGQIKICHHYSYRAVSSNWSAINLYPEGKNAWCATDQVKIIAQDNELDLALVTAPISKAAQNVAQLKVWAGNEGRQTPVIAMGFPHFNERHDSTVIRPRALFWSEGVILGAEDYEVQGRQMTGLRTSADILFGMSGGPLVDESGAVVGVLDSRRAANSNGVNDRSYSGGVIPIETVIRFLKQFPFIPLPQN